MSRRPRAGDALLRAIGVDFVNFAGSLTVENASSRSWASITFSGERHRLVLRLDGPGSGAAVAAFLDGLGEREFALRGHLLADISCHECEHWDHSARLILEALTVEAD